MFEAFDPERDLKFESLFELNSNKQIKQSDCEPDADCLMILRTGFRTRVLSYHSAHAMGARSGLSLSGLRERVPICAAMIRAGLSCAIDETLFSVLVYHYASQAKCISKECKGK